MSYASQEPWLFNSSVQQNIIFDSPMDKERYEQVQIAKKKIINNKLLHLLLHLRF